MKKKLLSYMYSVTATLAVAATIDLLEIGEIAEFPYSIIQFFCIYVCLYYVPYAVTEDKKLQKELQND
jgi:hypothetical protein